MLSPGALLRLPHTLPRPDRNPSRVEDETGSLPDLAQQIDVHTKGRCPRCGWRHCHCRKKLEEEEDEEEDDEDVTDVTTSKTVWETVINSWQRISKIGVFLLIWIVFTGILVMKGEKPTRLENIIIPEGQTTSYLVSEHPAWGILTVKLVGPFLPLEYENLTDSRLSAWVEIQHTNTSAEVISDVWKIPIASMNKLHNHSNITYSREFELSYVQEGSGCTLNIAMKTNLNSSYWVWAGYDILPVDTIKAVCGAAVLVGLYIAIITEVVPRTLSAIIASTMSVAILALMDERPTMQELISWVDMETMLLLFSMMMIVGVLSETGVFDYFSDKLYKWTKDSPTKLTFMLCLATAVFSLFLDNVTTILLLSPCTIRLCHMTSLNPVPVLMATVIFSNIGGTITPIGDPPNVLIASAFESAGVTLMNFILHMGTGTIIVLVVTWVMLWNSFSDMSSLEYTESSDIVDLRRRMDVWQRLAESLSSYSKDEDSVRKSLKRKVQKLNKKLHKHDKNITSSLISEKGNKKDKSNEIQYGLLIKTIVALVFTIVMFLVRSFTDVNITLGWIALLGAILLLILADEEPIDGVLGRVEWGTLLFFASLFILMEATSKLGLIQAIGNLTEYIIMLVHEETRLTLAILLILWVSAIVSALVDNIPLTTMMVRIISKLNAELGLPIQPLAWALAFGACLGGNGTLIGASANVVCAGVAEQHGYRFTFNEFFKVGFPVTLINIMITSIYLLVCHVFYTWH